MLQPEGVKEKRYCGYHNTNSHSINDCRVFRVRIQKAIQEGHLEFNSKMKVDREPFPQNAISFFINEVSVDSSNAREEGVAYVNRLISEKKIERVMQTENSRIKGIDTPGSGIASLLVFIKCT